MGVMLLRLLGKALSNMGMDKSGTQAGNTAAVQVTGWAARAGSTVVNNQLVANGNGTKTVHWKATMTALTPAGGQTFDLRKNGVVIATVNIPASTSTTTFADTSVTLAAGDTLDLFKRAASPARGISATGTYVYWD